MTTNISKKLISISDRFDNRKNYWLDRLAGVPLNNNFPYDYKNQDKFQYKKQRVEFNTPDNLFNKLNHLCNGSEDNLFIILLTALTVLINKYNGNNDLTVAVPIYKQDEEGQFINTV